MKPSRWFWVACAAESVLALAAAALGELFHQPPLARCGWNGTDAGIGLVTAIPLFVLFVRMLKSKSGCVRGIRLTLEERVRPLFDQWSVVQLALISLCAGVGEELLFRGFLQEKLAGSLGTTVALLVASALFGCVHPITLTYALVTAGVGAYLGGLMIVTGNLLAPIVTHTAYDFLALVYFLRAHRATADRGAPGDT